MKHWYAVYTKPRAEDTVTRLLDYAGIETMNPKLRRRKFLRSRYDEVVEPLFPCYVFAHFDWEEDGRLVKFTRGVKYIVGREYPLPVHEELIQAIRDRLQNGVVRIVPQRLAPGDAVRVDEGPFKDFYGVFERDIPGRERVLILLNALHSRLEIELRSLRKVE